jgi:hypothetical protein
MKLLQANYDLDLYPARWNYLDWLIGMEIVRRRDGYEKLLVKFTPGREKGFRGSDERKDVSIAAQQQILDNVCKPLLPLIGAEEGGDGSFDKNLAYTPKFILDCHSKGLDIPQFTIDDEATEWAKQYAGAITVTLRECNYQQERNSNLRAWQEFSHVCGERVVFVRDTFKMHETMGGYETCPKASKYVQNRIALYRAAKLNFFVSNGPVTLAYYDPKIAYICFVKSPVGYHINTDEWWTKHVGIKCGEQWPWAKANQRMVKAGDLFFNIREEYEKFLQSSPTSGIKNV